MMKARTIRLVALFSIVLAAFLIVYGISHLGEPDNCALCKSNSLHAPGLLNIETGDLTELRIYEPHPHRDGELSTSQRGGYTGISIHNGTFVAYDPYAQTAKTTITLKQARLQKTKFCRQCRNLLADSKQNYIIVDAYDVEKISVYDITEGVCCKMRDYTVSASISENQKSAIVTVSGSLYSN